MNPIRIHFQLFPDLPSVTARQCWALLSGDKNAAKLDVLVTLFRNYESSKGMNSFVKKLRSIPDEVAIKKARDVFFQNLKQDNLIESIELVFCTDSLMALKTLIQGESLIRLTKRFTEIIKKISESASDRKAFALNLCQVGLRVKAFLDLEIFLEGDGLTFEGQHIQMLYTSLVIYMPAIIEPSIFVRPKFYKKEIQ